MLDFSFQVPTNILFGKNVECNVGEEMKKLGKKALFLHYGAAGRHIYDSGLYDRIVRSMKEAGMEFIEMDGVVPNPRVSRMREGVELCKREGVDCILGVGGGSVFDSCKGIGIGACSTHDILDFCGGKVPVEKCLPIGCIVTIPAAGSEVSPTAMVVNDDVTPHQKPSIWSDLLRPHFAMLNPELTYSLPTVQTAAGAMDVMSHTLERYLGDVTGQSDLIDRFCESILQSVLKFAPIALDCPHDAEAREQLMLAATLCHCRLLDCGRIADWGFHRIEAQVTSLKDIPHGVGLATITPAMMRFLAPRDEAHFLRFATRIMGVEENAKAPRRTIATGIDRFEEFLHRMGLPTSISEVGCVEEDIQAMADRATENGIATVGAVYKLTRDEVVEIYRSALNPGI